VSSALAQRIVALGAVALLVGAGVLVLVTMRGGSSSSSTKSHPRPVHWYSALAAPYTPPARTSCGLKTGPATIGVAHPVLPCGAKLFVSLGGTEVLTEVIDKGSQLPGREFDVTTALAGRLGMHGTQRIRWAFAR
jgi:hypothetical protein